MPTEYNTQELKSKASRHLWMSYQPPEPYAAEGGPPVLITAKGAWMVDTEGNRYLDGVSALEACVGRIGGQNIREGARLWPHT